MKLPRRSDDKYVVEAVARALDLLEAFHHSEELTLQEISRRTKINKSRGFRLLHTLAERGYVERTLDGTKYKLGLKLFEHASRIRRNVSEVAYPFMFQLRERFNETVNLGIVHNDKVLYIAQLESSRPFRMASMIGSRMPLTSTALGKAMIAHASDKDVKRFAAQLSPGKLRRLRRELEFVQRRGYAFDEEENEPGVSCVGAPIFDRFGSAIAAMSLSGSTPRLSARQKELGNALIIACNEISRRLGFGRKNRKRPMGNVA